MQAAAGIHPRQPDLYDFMTGIRYLNFIADIFLHSRRCPGGTHPAAGRFV